MAERRRWRHVCLKKREKILKEKKGNMIQLKEGDRLEEEEGGMIN